MTRPLAVVALFALPALASAQINVPPGSVVTVGPPMIGGRLVTGAPITNGASSLYAVQTPGPARFGVGGGSLAAAPPLLVPSGPWGGVSYPPPVSVVTVEPPPVPVVRSRARSTGAPSVVQSGEAGATLVVQLPAAGELWVGGKKVAGDPASEWTLTSPALPPGAAHTFEVKSRWTTGGKTFEASRSVSVAAGDRSRSIIVSGTEARN